VSIREEYPELRLAGARTCDEEGKLIAAAYLCEYPGALGVLMGPWTASSEGLTFQDRTVAPRISIDDLINHLSDDAAVRTLKLLLAASRHWQVELVQSLDHRSCAGEATTRACGEVVASSKNVLLGKRLEASGMQWLTTLEHLQLQLGTSSLNLNLDSDSDSTSIRCDLASPNSWTRFRWQDASRWSDWLDGTYIDSRDCPELNGIRSTSMTLQGYWALTGFPTENAFFAQDDAEVDAQEGDGGLGQSSAYRKERNIEWWGLRSLHSDSTRQADSDCENALTDPHRDRPIEAGFMLSQTSRDAWELTYMGVHRSYRGNGLGKVCLAKAIERVARWNGLRLSLAVDARNHVCRDLYKAFGFQPVSEIDAWIYNPLKNDSRKSRTDSLL
jgi:ribosomal protein S18 acetylase RimI-like enzyme